MQDKFYHWLVEKEGKSRSTANAYCSAIRQLSIHYSDFEHTRVNLFEVPDPNQLDRIAMHYDSFGKYSEVGEKGHRTYINGIKALVRFRNNTPSTSHQRVSTVTESIIQPSRFDFDPVFKAEAAAMSQHYEVFYCLERSIRSLIVKLMEEAYGVEWWTSRVPPEIQSNVDSNIQREEDTGYTKRSTTKIDYTTFGELRRIVRYNWDAFSSHLSSLNAFNSIMVTLNTLRVPIAHCTPLAEDEILRLQLTVKDWFRLIGKES